jgi:hypothetical protein
MGVSLVHVVARLLFTPLKIFPSIGPKTSKVTKTTSTTKTRINAYSTRPCALSFTGSNKAITSFQRDFFAAQKPLHRSISTLAYRGPKINFHFY